MKRSKTFEDLKAEGMGKPVPKENLEGFKEAMKNALGSNKIARAKMMRNMREHRILIS